MPREMSRRQLLRLQGIKNATGLVACYEPASAHGDVEGFEAILPGEGRKPVRTLVDILPSARSYAECLPDGTTTAGS
jgi:hypothetical protein